MAAQETIGTKSGAGVASKPVVLVIDDQVINVRLVTALLVQAGYVVMSALGGSEGLALAQRCAPDVVLLDMRMPQVDGFDVLRQLRQDPALAHLPVIFLTADDDRENLIRAFTAEVTDYITKPFVGRELLARVHTHVELKKARDALLRLEQERRDLAELITSELRARFSHIIAATDHQCACKASDEAQQTLAQSIRGSADSGLLFLQKLLDPSA